MRMVIVKLLAAPHRRICGLLADQIFHFRVTWLASFWAEKGVVVAGNRRQRTSLAHHCMLACVIVSAVMWADQHRATWAICRLISTPTSPTRLNLFRRNSIHSEI